MRRCILGTLLCGLAGACSVSNTGNPHTSSGGSHPEGITLLRSELAHDQAPSVSDAERTQFGADQRQFAFKLFGELSADNPNLFYSPYSISTALGMTYAGARAETKTEMVEALSFSLSEPTLHAAFNATDLALDKRASEVDAKNGGNGFELSTINAHFAEKTFKFQDDFLDLLAQQYDSGVFLADFAGQAERERDAINAWVRQQTKERVDELLPDASLDGNTKLVLVNTIYFKGSWLLKFDPAQTTDAPFHAPGGDTNVPMMHNSQKRDYARGDGYQAVALPYVSENVRMLLILPDEGKQAQVEGQLASGLFDEARAALSEYSVDLRLPRFSFSTDLDLIPALEGLGMERAFGDADFSGIGGAPGQLFITGVFHQAFVAVDEEGTEAAAATAVVLGERGVSNHVAVTFDRPFLFMVYDEPTGVVLFAGRLSEP